MDNVREYGFKIKLTKPINEYTTEELNVLIDDTDMLSREEDALATKVEEEVKRREELVGTCNENDIPCKWIWVSPQYDALACAMCGRPPNGQMTDACPTVTDNYVPYPEMKGVQE